MKTKTIIFGNQKTIIKGKKGVLTLSELPVHETISTGFIENKKDIEKIKNLKPSVKMIFKNIEGLDVLIEALLLVKEEMEDNYENKKR